MVVIIDYTNIRVTNTCWATLVIYKKFLYIKKYEQMIF